MVTGLFFGACAACAATAVYYGMPSVSAAALVRANRLVAGLRADTVLVGRHRVRYLSGGGGPTVVLLHGIFAEKDHWLDFARHLTRRFRVVIPDLPGYGESTRLADARYDYSAQTARVARLLDVLGLSGVHLAGNSMGGTIAALLAKDRPDLVASVAFVGAPHGLRTPLKSKMDLLIEDGVVPLVARTGAEFASVLDLLFAKRPFLPSPIRRVATADAILRSQSNMKLWGEQLEDRYLLEEKIEGLRQPVAVLWGARDKVFDVSGAGVLQERVAHANIHVLGDIGHLPMMEAPAASARIYRDFLTRASTTAAPK